MGQTTLRLDGIGLCLSNDIPHATEILELLTDDGTIEAVKKEIPLENPGASSYLRDQKEYAPDKAIDKDEETRFTTGGHYKETFFADFLEGTATVFEVNFLAKYGVQLHSAIIEVSGKHCGQLPTKLDDDKWYTVVCDKPLIGHNIRI